MPNHLDRMMITNAQMTRWHHAAARLGDGGLELRSGLENLARDPTRHMLLVAANAARHAGRLSVGVRAELADASGRCARDQTEDGHRNRPTDNHTSQDARK